MKKPPGNAEVAGLFEAHARALVLYARQWAGVEGAEDVVQRVFVRMIVGGRLPEEPRTWLFRCVRNEAISYQRSEGRRGRGGKAGAGRGWFVSKPEDRVDGDAAQAAVESLEAELREVILLRLWSGLTLMEIAA